MSEKGDGDYERIAKRFNILFRKTATHGKASNKGKKQKTQQTEKKTCPQKMDISEITFQKHRWRQQCLVNNRKEVQYHVEKIAAADVPGETDPSKISSKRP